MAGFLSRLFASQSAPPVPAAAFVGWDDMEVAGESHHRDGIAAVFGAIGRPGGGVTMTRATLVPEPSNRFDPYAVKVMVDGHHVGYLPAEDSRRVRAVVPRGGTADIPARVWARNDDGIWRARVTLAFSGAIEAERDYAADEEQRRRSDEARQIGSVRGAYWSVWKQTVAELKRQGNTAEARTLLGECQMAAEREAAILDAAPAPWPTVQLAILARQVKDADAERAVLERYATLCGERPIPDQVMGRLLSVRAKGA